jgi:pentatricopeptide repeat protein
MEFYWNVLLSSTSISPDLHSWAAMLHGYTQVGDILKATSVYKKIMQLPTSSSKFKSKKQRKIWYNAVLDMLLMYRIRIHEDPQSKTPLYLESADKLVHSINQSKILNSRQTFQISVTLMDLYARTGNVSKVNAILQQPELQNANPHPNQQSSRFNTVTAHVIIKAYGKARQGHKATQLVKEMLQSQSPESRPTITTFNTLLNALAESETTATVALETFQFLDQDPQCKQDLQLEPNLFTFAALLKCLSRSVDPNAGNQAEQVLHNMLSRWKQSQDKSIKPNEVCYSLAIQACLSCGDHARAEAILRRLERWKSEHLGPRTYTTILKYHYSSIVPDAPNKAEQILDRMREMFKTYPKVYPNPYCYNLVLATWSRHKDVELAADSMWKLFLEMQEEKEYSAAPDMVTYTTLITFFVRSGSDRRNLQWIQKADTLLHFMETSENPSCQPGVEHYQMVMDGWLVLEDVSRATGVLLRRTKAGIHRKKLGPTPAAIQKVLQGWIHTNQAKNGIHLVRATVLLEELEKWKEKVQCDEDNNRQEDSWKGPDRRNYATLLSAWQNSRHPKKNQYVESLKTKLTDMDSQIPSQSSSLPADTGNPGGSPLIRTEKLVLNEERTHNDTSTTSTLPR